MRWMEEENIPGRGEEGVWKTRVGGVGPLLGIPEFGLARKSEYEALGMGRARPRRARRP